MADAWNKKYVLKHKNIAVAEIELDEATGAISAIFHAFGLERRSQIGYFEKCGL